MVDPDPVVANHNPEHTLVCGGCGDSTRGSAEDVRAGRVTFPKCTHDETTQPAPGYPLPEWLDANRDHPKHSAYVARHLR